MKEEQIRHELARSGCCDSRVLGSPCEVGLGLCPRRRRNLACVYYGVCVVYVLAICTASGLFLLRRSDNIVLPGKVNPDSTTAKAFPDRYCARTGQPGAINTISLQSQPTSIRLRCASP